MGVYLRVPDSEHSVYIRYSGLAQVKRILIEQTLRVAEAKDQREAASQLQKWIAAPAPLSMMQKMAMCQANGFPAHMATDPMFSDILENCMKTLNHIALPSSCPQSLSEVGFAGVYDFVRHSDCDGEYSRGQCVNIADWMAILFDKANGCEFGDADEIVLELRQLFDYAVEVKKSVRLG